MFCLVIITALITLTYLNNYRLYRKTSITYYWLYTDTTTSECSSSSFTKWTSYNIRM